MNTIIRASSACAVALVAGAVMLASVASAQGTAAEAKAMLAKTVSAVKANKAKALEEINKGESGFLKGDLYAFCFNLSNGKVVANANPSGKGHMGMDIRTIKEANGKPFGREIYEAAKPGQTNEVRYMYPKPGPDKKPVPKVSFVTAVDGLGCGVGYYK